MIQSSPVSRASRVRVVAEIEDVNTCFMVSYQSLKLETPRGFHYHATPPEDLAIARYMA